MKGQSTTLQGCLKVGQAQTQTAAINCSLASLCITSRSAPRLHSPHFSLTARPLSRQKSHTAVKGSSSLCKYESQLSYYHNNSSFRTRQTGKQQQICNAPDQCAVPVQLKSATHLINALFLPSFV